MTPDQVVRAVDYLEAVWGGDSEVMEQLDGFAPGELPTRFLLAAFLELVVTSAGIVEATSDSAPSQERQDLAATASGVLVRAMQEWSQTAEPDLPEDGSLELELPWDYNPRIRGHRPDQRQLPADRYLRNTRRPDLRLEAFRTVVAAMPSTE